MSYDGVGLDAISLTSSLQGSREGIQFGKTILTACAIPIKGREECIVAILDLDIVCCGAREGEIGNRLQIRQCYICSDKACHVGSEQK